MDVMFSLLITDPDIDWTVQAREGQTIALATPDNRFGIAGTPEMIASFARTLLCAATNPHTIGAIPA